MAYGKIAIIGSGELSESMAEVHRNLMAQLGDAPRPVFVDTLAGFELNIDGIDQKASAYFKRNLGLDLSLAKFRSRRDPADVIAAAISAIQRANYIFAGPGSPSYGIAQWRDSRVWEAIVTRWHEGAMLVFASAAALSLGQLSIPVYEIYKVGTDVSWITGLNLLHEIGIDAAIVPHYNNNSGDQHDTRFCFMGAPRFAELETLLPPEVAIVGVDEYTALVIDSDAHRATVLGAGAVSIRREQQQHTFSKGEVIDFDHLTLSAAPLAVKPVIEAEAALDENPRDLEISSLRETLSAAFDRGDFAQVAEGLLTLNLIASMGLEQGLRGRTEQAVEALQALLPRLGSLQPAASGAAEAEAERAALLDLLLDSRMELRRAKQWAASDMIRDRLIALHYSIADTPAGSTWQRLDS